MRNFEEEGRSSVNLDPDRPFLIIIGIRSIIVWFCEDDCWGLTENMLAEGFEIDSV